MFRILLLIQICSIKGLLLY